MPADAQPLPRPVVFGEVLFDRFPDGSEVTGGAPFNVAWHLTAFGARPLFLSRVGRDALGEHIVARMTDWGMDLAGLQHDPDHATGTVDVAIVDGEPSYTIVPDRAWDHIDATALPQVPADGLLYHGSLATRSPEAAAALQALQTQLPRSALLDVNLRDPWWQASAVQAQMRRAEWLKVNGQELRRLLPHAGDEAGAVAELLSDYGVGVVIVTHGADGANAWSAQGAPLRTAPGDAVEVVDTVGAGDAFASVLLLGRHHGWPLQTILDRAQDFAAALVGVRGATIADRAFYRPFIEQWGLA